MVKINAGSPIIVVHIMKHYIEYGFKNFIIATGYKGRGISKNILRNFKKNGKSFKATIFKNKM